jgi:hypothetical protein
LAKRLAKLSQKWLKTVQNIVVHTLSIPKHYNISSFGQVLNANFEPVISSSFLAISSSFQALITRLKLDQHSTYYSVLKSSECVQQYSGQIEVIFAIVWTGASPTQNEATAIKLGHFQALVTVDWTCLLKKLLTCKMNYKSC